MDMKNNTDKKMERLFSLSRDAVLGFRDGRAVFANDAARRRFGEGILGLTAEELLPGLDIRTVEEEFLCPVKVGRETLTVSAVRMDELLTVTVPCRESLRPMDDGVLQELRRCAFSLRMTLDAAFPAETRSEQQETYAAVLYHHQYTLLRLTAELADTAALADGSFSCLLKPADLGQICADLVDSVNLFTNGQTARVEFSCAPTGFPCMADTDRMEQLLLKLLCNALEHTPADGTVVMELRQQGEQLILSIDDNGSGIPSSRLRDIFSPGAETSAADMAPRGIGFGLHVAQGIVRAHGGTMILRSREGEGTHIRITLPISRRLILRDSAGWDRGPRLLLTELAPVLSHQTYRRAFRD